MIFPRNFSAQKTVMEALDSELTQYLTETAPIPVSGANPPTQKELEAAWVAAGHTLPIQPDRDFLWYDGRILRGQYSAMHDYLSPLASNYSLDEYGTNQNVTALSRVWWEDDYHLILAAQYRGIASTLRLYLDGFYELIAAFPPIGFERVSHLAYYIGAASQIFKVDVQTNTATGLTTTTAASPGVVLGMANGDIFFNDGAGANANRLIKKRTAAGVVTTIYDASANYAGGFWAVHEMFYHAGTSQLIVVMREQSTQQMALFRITDTGTGFTQLIAPTTTDFGADSGFGFRGGYHLTGDIMYYIGATGTMSSASTIDVLTGAAGAASVLDYGGAKDTYKEALAEDVVTNITNLNMTTAPSQYPGINLPKAFTSVAWRLPSPNQKNWFLSGRTNSGFTPSHQWWVLSDPVNANYIGSTGRMFTMTAFHNGLPDFYRAATLVNDGARQELILDWSDADSQARLADYDILQIVFDNWLQTADDTIRIQLNGDTGSNYLFSQWTISAAVVANTNGSAQASINLPGRFNATVFGGSYILTFIDHRSPDNHRWCLIEGGTQTGITSTLMRATLGVGIWQNNVPITSIRIFTTGTGVFPAGVQVSLIGLKTKARYRRSDPIYAPYLG